MQFFNGIQYLALIFLFQWVTMPVLVGPLHENPGTNFITGIFQKGIGEYEVDEFIDFRVALGYFVNFCRIIGV